MYFLHGLPTGLSGGALRAGDLCVAGMHPVWEMRRCLSGGLPAFHGGSQTECAGKRWPAER